MDNTVSFYFAILTILLIYFINNLNLSFSNVIAITSTIIIVYLSYNYVNDNKTSTLLLYEDKLNNIYPKPKFFHLDINFIDIIYNLQDLRELNPSAFNSLVLTIDNFLKIENDILNKGVYLPKENIDVILDLKRSAINNLHSFYFNVPVSKIYDLKLSNWIQVTTHFGIDTEPDWSPDSRKILFTSNRSGSPQIYEANIKTNRIKRITFDGTYNARGRYLPNGKDIVFVHRRNGVFHIAKQNLRSGNINILTDTSLDESPTVSPNGNVVIYATKDGDKDILAGITLDGKTKFIMPSLKGEAREPSWSPLID